MLTHLLLIQVLQSDKKRLKDIKQLGSQLVSPCGDAYYDQAKENIFTVPIMFLQILKLFKLIHSLKLLLLEFGFSFPGAVLEHEST